MKKQLSILLALFLASAGLNSIDAQTSVSYGTDPQISPVKIESPATLSEEDVLTNVQEKFHKHFPDVQVDSWIKTNEGYAIRFLSRSVDNLVFYNAKAKITGQVKYYKAEKLPFDVRFQVESSYCNYKIVSVQEVIVGKSKTYLVAVNAENDWKIIRISDEGLDVYKEYRKG